MRKHYIDNIRSLIILCLIPFHVLMFYTPAHGGEMTLANTPVSALSAPLLMLSGTWIMPLLFLNAGMTTFYSLKRRSYRQYLAERVKKLLLPFLVGMLTVVPIMFYFSRLSNGTAGDFFTFYKEYVLTPGIRPFCHLWFLFVLFGVSLVGLPLIMLARKRGWSLPTEKLTFPVLVALVVPLLLLGAFIDIGVSVSMSGALVYFLLGYFVFAQDGVVERLVSKRWWLLGAYLALTAANFALLSANINTTYGFLIAPDQPVYPWFGLVVTWAGILTVRGFAAKRLEFHNWLTEYLARASFSLYIFHYCFVMIVGCWITSVTGNALVQFVVMVIGASALNFAFYELVRRIPGVRFLFGISAPKKKPSSAGGVSGAGV